MSLYDQIKEIYPNITDQDFMDTIVLQNDNDGKGDYIKLWDNENPQPTPEQLKATKK